MTRNIKEFVNYDVAPRSAQSEFTCDHVCILLALHNGAAYLSDQLASIAGQSHRDWSLIISDDGSSDHWLDIAKQFSETAASGRTWLINGPRRGYAQNFIFLLKSAGPFAPYAAFCDQDDVWMEDKLARAVARLKAIADTNKPAVYCSRTVICDKDCNADRFSPDFQLPPSFRNALVQNVGGGNTMVLNRAALDLVQDTLHHARDVVSHDWWVYQIVSGAGGTVIFDETPSLYYRQHGRNLVGANDSMLASLRRLAKVFAGQYRRWNKANTEALRRSIHWLTPEARDTLRLFCEARDGSFVRRLRALRQSGVYRQSRRGTVALWAAAVTRRL